MTRASACAQDRELQQGDEAERDSASILDGKGQIVEVGEIPSVGVRGGSLGTLCLGGGVGRFDRPGEARTADGQGTVTLDVDLSDVPQPLAAQSVVAGETWRFQAWYRDAVNGVATSNFSGSLAVEFR